jgi:hypothetical protein
VNGKTLHQSKEFTMSRFSQCEVGGTIRRAPVLHGRVRTIVAGVACLLTLTLAAQPAAAQQFIGTFGRVANDPFSGRIIVVNKLSQSSGAPSQVAVNIKPKLDAAWDRLRPLLTKHVPEQLRERDIGSGFRTYQVKLNLDTRGELFVGVDGRGFTLKYLLRNNSLTTKLRVPGPTPSGLDPKVRVNFDMEVTLEVEPKAGVGLVAGPAKVKFLRVKRPSGANVTGSLGVGAANLVRFLGGPDFVGIALKAVRDKDVKVSGAVNLELDKLAPIIRKAGTNVEVRPTFDRARNELVLELHKRTPTILR